MGFRVLTARGHARALGQVRTRPCWEGPASPRAQRRDPCHSDPDVALSLPLAAQRVCTLLSDLLTSQLTERMAGSHVLWLALAFCILTPAPTEQQGECFAHLASQVPLCTWGVSREVQTRWFWVSGRSRVVPKAKTKKLEVKGNKNAGPRINNYPTKRQVRNPTPPLPHPPRTEGGS